MKIGIQTWGTRGDVNPWIALGQGLQKSGHEVTLFYTCFTNVDFNNYSQKGLSVRSTKEFCTNPKIYENVPYKAVFDMDESDGNNYILGEVYSLFDEEIILTGEHLCKNNDLIINSNLLYQISSLAEKYQVPLITVHANFEYAKSGDDQSYIDEVLNSIYKEKINKLRKKLGLTPISNARTEILCSTDLNLLICSKIFCNEIDLPIDSNFKICGFMEMEVNTTPETPLELSSFLEQGKPPVFFSLGSLSFFERNIQDVLDLFVKAIRLSGCRAIIQADWENISYQLPSDLSIYKISYVSHNLVFPYCLCIVHHGGAGTTHTALVNGCPSIVMAYAWDQFSWGWMLNKLGTSPGLLKRKNVDEIQLAGFIKNIMVNPEYKSMAEKCRRKMKREAGVKKAVRLIEAYLSTKNEYSLNKL
jgi:UDP:flavonoid glycosyltransferase YjiC (YdhE family)